MLGEIKTKPFEANSNRFLWERIRILALDVFSTIPGSELIMIFLDEERKFEQNHSKRIRIDFYGNESEYISMDLDVFSTIPGSESNFMYRHVGRNFNQNHSERIQIDFYGSESEFRIHFYGSGCLFYYSWIKIKFSYILWREILNETFLNEFE